MTQGPKTWSERDEIAPDIRVADPGLVQCCIGSPVENRFSQKVLPVGIAPCTRSISLPAIAVGACEMRQKPQTSRFNGTPVTKAYRPNKGHCSGMLYSFKSGKQCPWRGLLERDAMILWDVAPEVESFWVEPVKIPYVMPSGRPSYYTPDRLVHYHDARPSLLVEIKPKRFLRRKRAIWNAKFAAARAYAKDQGWEFDVWTEKQIHGTHLENAVFLRDFLAYTPDEPAQERLLVRLADMGETTGEELLASITDDVQERASLLPQLWLCIALRRIHADWSKLITIHSRLSLGEGGPLK